MANSQLASALAAESLEVGYGGRAILPPQTFALPRGSLTVVVGRNGCGKTTLFRTLIGLLKPIRGRVVKPEQGLKLGYMAQGTAFDRILPLRAEEIVAWGCLGATGVAAPLLSKAHRKAAAAALQAAHASDLGGRFFRDLSEGQKQRVLLARLLASEPAVALLDEPTSAMDAPAEAEILRLLATLAAQRGIAVVIVSHMLSLAPRFASQMAWIDRPSQRVLWGTPNEILDNADFQQLFGRLGETP